MFKPTIHIDTQPVAFPQVKTICGLNDNGSKIDFIVLEEAIKNNPSATFEEMFANEVYRVYNRESYNICPGCYNLDIIALATLSYLEL